jgi:hypothetical protein
MPREETTTYLRPLQLLSSLVLWLCFGAPVKAMNLNSSIGHEPMELGRGLRLKSEELGHVNQQWNLLGKAMHFACNFAISADDADLTLQPVEA